MANIKKILVSGTTYDVEALHFVSGTLDTPAQWKEYIDSLVGEGLQIVIDEKSSSGDYPATTASANTMGKIYMVALSGQTESGTYTEFVTVKTGTTSSPVYSWEKIGTTAADLSEYAKKGTYTSAGPSTNATGSAGAETIDTTETDLGTATGTIRLVDHTISAHSHTVNAATTSVNTDAIKDITLSASDTTTDGPAYVSAASLGGTKTFNTDAIKDFSLSASDTSTDGPAYISAVSGTFNTDAIKNVTLSASDTTADGPAYIESISGSAPSLTGTKTFATEGIKNPKTTPSETTTDGAAFVESISGSAPSLGGTKTFVTGYGSFSGGSGGFTPTTKYMKVSTTATSASDKGTVTLSGGSATGTFNTDAIKGISGTKNYGFSSSTSNLMYSPSVDANGVLSWSTENAGTQDAHTGTAASTRSVSYTAPTLGGTTSFLTSAVKSVALSASSTSGDGPTYIESATHSHTGASLGTASTGTVSISGGSYTATTKYMKISADSASTGTVGISGGSYTGTTKYMKKTTTAASTGSVSKTTKYMKHTNTSAGTGTVSLSTTTKYMKHTNTAASTTSVMTGATLSTAGGATLTHSVSSTAATLAVSVALGKHKHSVTTSNHTHTLSNHTHGTTI